jgi:predicted RNase H-like HicB family nuclease
MSKYKLIIEKNKEGYWSQVEKLPSVFSSGKTMAELIDNTKDAIELYFDGSEQKIENIRFELVMDIQEFFNVNEYINITSLASRIGMNPSLLRQYSKGIKFPSLEQVSKIEKAIKQIGEELVSTELQPV